MMNLKPHERKGNRLQIRVDAAAYHVLEKAAHYRHGSLSQFVREASLEKAKKIIRDHENMSLSEEDWSLCMDALSNPVSPNPSLQKAYVQYQKISKK